MNMNTPTTNSPHQFSVAVAAANSAILKQVTQKIRSLGNCCIATTAENGRELILDLQKVSQPIGIVVVSMQMPSSDGLLTTTLCKKLFPTSSIIGFSEEASPTLISDFFAEGGDGFFTLGAETITWLPNSASGLQQLLAAMVKGVLPKHLSYTDSIGTQQIIKQKFHHFSTQDILYLQLNAAGFTREQMATIMYKSVSCIKKHYAKLTMYFGTQSSYDLAAISINLGIVKVAKLY